jgi:2-keto-4-pentenoate hydratase/2-oxohepta-3-ene-1,7-dioic acid hydratase in catechol pathway
MKLVSFQRPAERREVVIGAVLASGSIVDLASAYEHVLVQQGASPRASRRMAEAFLPGDMVAFIEGGAPARAAAEEAVAWAERDQPDGPGIYRWDAVRRLAPVPEPPLLRDFMAFEEHLQNIYPRLGRPIPEEWYQMPVYYKGNPASTATDGDAVVIPEGADALDLEFELALVIGKSGSDIPKDRAMDYIYGYMIYNDFSERAIQAREMTVGLGPAKGKDFVGAHVLGPWLVTVDEIPDPYALAMSARVNGETWCTATSGAMYWRLPDLVAHASRGEPIRAGEVWGTGTVGGGSGMEAGRALEAGDTVELAVQGLGVLRNRVVRHDARNPR